MSNELKCPFCGEELKISGHELHDLDLYCDKCEPFMVGNKELWQEFIRTRKALDVALDAIDTGEAALIGCQEADDKYISDVTAEDGLKLMSKAYKEITALKQKDVK